jgi:hypothetical protein
LTELNATIATIEQIDGVLDDVNVLLSKDHPESVYRKQASCIKSLRKWEIMVKSDMRGGGKGKREKSPGRKRKEGGGGQGRGENQLKRRQKVMLFNLTKINILVPIPNPSFHFMRLLRKTLSLKLVEG